MPTFRCPSAFVTSARLTFVVPPFIRPPPHSMMLAALAGTAAAAEALLPNKTCFTDTRLTEPRTLRLWNFLVANLEPPTVLTND